MAGLTARAGAGSYGGGGGSGLVPVPDVISYAPPEYDESQIRAYQQEALAPGVSGLRRSMREAQAGRYSSPSARREALRGVTRGFGEALAPLQVGAGAQARQRYDLQYQQKVFAEQQQRAAQERREWEQYRQQLEAADRERQEAAQAELIAPTATYAQPAPTTTFTSPYGSYTQPGTSQVRGLGEASRRPLPQTTSTGLEGQTQTQTAFPDDWTTRA